MGVSATSTVSPTTNAGRPSTIQRASPTAPPGEREARDLAAQRVDQHVVRAQDAVGVEAGRGRGDPPGDPGHGRSGRGGVPRRRRLGERERPDRPRRPAEQGAEEREARQ